MDSPREVIHSPRFDAELEDIERDPRLADQVLHALTWALARHPATGFPIPGTPLWIWPVYIKSREYVVYYRYSETSVELLAIRPSDEETPL